MGSWTHIIILIIIEIVFVLTTDHIRLSRKGVENSQNFHWGQEKCILIEESLKGEYVLITSYEYCLDILVINRWGKFGRLRAFYWVT